jgi:hypothetical protein
VPGIADLEPTGLSGIRFYQPGATIAEHVDMADLNVVSALINIDQMVRPFTRACVFSTPHAPP